MHIVLAYLLGSEQETPGHFLLAQFLPSFQPQSFAFEQACMRGRNLVEAAYNPSISSGPH